MIALRALAMIILMAALPSPASGASRDVDHERLSRSLAQLETDPALAPYAAGEIASARAALDILLEDSRGKKRVHALYVAERRVDIAWAAAQVADFSKRQGERQREHDRLMLAAARYEAEQARRELEQQHLQLQIDAEDAERAARAAEEARLLAEQDTAALTAESEQSRRVADALAREAALAKQEAMLSGAADESARARLDAVQATRGDAGMQMSLDDVAFAAGQSTLRVETRNSLGVIVAFVNRDPSKAIRIEGHTDATGAAEANLALSQQRADAVRDALVEDGVDATRITAIGLGSERPVASSATADGRAKNRRVNVIILD